MGIMLRMRALPAGFIAPCLPTKVDTLPIIHDTQPEWFVGKMPRRSGALRRCTGMGAKPRAPRLAGFGFVMVPYRSLPLGPRSCDLRSITPLSQKCAYQRQPASEEPRVLEVARLKSNETELKLYVAVGGSLLPPFRAKRGRPAAFCRRCVLEPAAKWKSCAIAARRGHPGAISRCR